MRLQRIAPKGAQHTIDTRKKEWTTRHQPFELEFHQRHNFRWNNEMFMAQWAKLFGEFCGFSQEYFGESDTIIDIGCGSRSGFEWFTSSCNKYHLDPLLDQYIQIPQVKQYWTDKAAEALLSQPAEVFITTLDGQCAFAHCWNVLDHTYDWRSILLNLWRYPKPDGYVLLGTDITSHGDGHPGIDDTSFFWDFVNTHFDILKRKDNYVGREHALLLRKRAIRE